MRFTYLPVFILFFFFAKSGISQNQSADKLKPEVNEVQKGSTPAAAGTFQFIYTTRANDPGRIPSLSINELIQIENERSDSEIVYLYSQVSDEIRIRVLPKKTITTGGFIPPSIKAYLNEEKVTKRTSYNYKPLK